MRRHVISRVVLLFLACSVVTILAVGGPFAAAIQKEDKDLLHIGSSGGIASGEAAKEKGALESLEEFIKEETGMKADIKSEKGWREVAEKMISGKYDLGVFL